MLGSVVKVVVTTVVVPIAASAAKSYLKSALKDKNSTARAFMRGWSKGSLYYLQATLPETSPIHRGVSNVVELVRDRDD